ncbi:MAG TPA: phosphohistidine phosphatase SixA [Candidatus Acidoferrales bacterium]|jgi:phosphohistidine phosphatase|nr:phosphohistidine phosphatase SixA [Candidatus Acidoferrales bacterium]
MNLYILRHGIASDPGEDGLPKRLPDAERPLSMKGKQRLGDVTWAMRKMELTFDAVLSSPLLRARQTAQMVTEALGAEHKIVFSDHLAPEGSPKALIEQVNGLQAPLENVLLVGHEPYLSRFIALLTTGGTTAEIDLRKGGLARLEVAELRYARCATLRWLVTPKQMSLMK